jgi:endoglucanase
VDGTPETQRVAEQGRGGAVSLADRGTVYDRDFARFIIDTAEKNSIPCQVKKFVSGGNDSSKIQRAAEGARVAAISAPARYIHTASNVIREDDLLSIERLAEALLRALA